MNKNTKTHAFLLPMNYFPYLIPRNHKNPFHYRRDTSYYIARNKYKYYLIISESIVELLKLLPIG